MFDYLIVGAGPYGAVMAHELTKAGCSCLVLDKREHVGGNIYTEDDGGITVHRYGAHIFHTSDERIVKFVNNLVEFKPFIHSPLANYNGELYNLPFNMNTFKALFGVTEPDDARNIIDEEIRREAGICGEGHEPANLEEQAIRLVGRTVYEKLIKGYTQKQWGRDCRELPPDIIRRIPLRFTYNNNYFNDTYSAIPKGGYTGLVEKLLEGIEVRTGTDYLKLRREKRLEAGGDLYDNPGLGLAREVIYSGTIDGFFDECFGPLEYRTLRFETERLSRDSFQPCAVVNYTDSTTPFTRIIEHRHFDADCKAKGTIITREYSKLYMAGDEPYYPINDRHNSERYLRYTELAGRYGRVHFGGRLGKYAYYDMDKVISAALSDSERLLKGGGA